MKEIGQDIKKLITSGSDVVKKIGSFGIEIETDKSNIKIKVKNLNFQEKLYNLVTSLLLVFQKKNQVRNIVSWVDLSNISFAKVDNKTIFSNIFLDIEAKSRRLLVSKNIRYQDRFLIDSFITKL